MTTKHIALPHRRDIQGLRAIAVLLVVFAHADVTIFAGGFVGVDVFFVLSGYLITGLLVREYSCCGRINFAGFWLRRLRRLFPALAFMLLAVLALTFLLMDSFDAQTRTRSVAYAASWTSNLYFSFSDFDYFSTLAEKDLFLHTWSLGVEEQFYLFWPILILVVLSLVDLRTRPAMSKCIVLALFLLLAFGSATLITFWQGNHPLWSFYLMPARIFQFAAGGAVFVGSHSLNRIDRIEHRLRQRKSLATAFMVIGLALILASACTISPYARYPDFVAFFPTFGAVLAVLGGTIAQGTSRWNLLLSQIPVWIGDCSYSIYLWHWPVFQLGRELGLIGDNSDVAIAIAATIVVAAFSYRYIEKPFWKGRFSSGNSGELVTAALAMVAICAISSVILNAPESDAHVQDGAKKYVPAFDVPDIYKMDIECDTWTKSAELRPCILAGKSSYRTVLLVGDSVGAQWVPALPEIFPANAWRSIVLTKSACPIIDEEYYYKAVGDSYRVCSDWRNSVLEYIRQSRPEIVLIGSSSHYDFSEQQWINGQERIIDSINDVVRQIVLIPGTPELKFNDLRCANIRTTAEWEANNAICVFDSAGSQSQVVAGYLTKVAEAYSNVHVLNLNDMVCPNGLCRRTDEYGMFVYRDHMHLTKSYVLARVPEVRRQLLWLTGDRGWPKFAGSSEPVP